MKDKQKNGLMLEEWQIEQFKLIGDLIRNDWSGIEFDGRDVKRWILATLDGENILEMLKEKDEEELLETLKEEKVKNEREGTDYAAYVKKLRY